MKYWKYLRWALMMLINLLGFLTAPVLYPIAYIVRDIPIIKYIFWLYYDREDGHWGTDWFREDKGYDLYTWWDRFKCAYHWSALRNPAWELQILLGVRDGVQKVIYTRGTAIRNGVEVDAMKFAGFKYVDKNGVYKNNAGEFLSKKYSTLGWKFTIYTVDDKITYWRYSYANNIFGKWWLEIQLGTNNYRYTWRLKPKRNLKIYEEQ